MNLIAAVDANWAIGKDNSLLVSIPEDMKFFRNTTSGHVVVMGRKTLESFPNGAPLKNRVNIVLTHNKDYSKDGAVIVRDTAELMEELKKYDTSEIFVIGGGSIYSLLLPVCDTAYITRIDAAFEADTYFPDLDKMEDWYIEERSETFLSGDLSYSFIKYKKRSK